MAKSAAAKFAMKMLAAVLSLGNRQMTTMVMPFPMREKIPETKEKSSKKDRIWQLSGELRKNSLIIFQIWVWSWHLVRIQSIVREFKWRDYTQNKPQSIVGLSLSIGTFIVMQQSGYWPHKVSKFWSRTRVWIQKKSGKKDSSNTRERLLCFDIHRNRLITKQELTFLKCRTGDLKFCIYRTNSMSFPSA